ncbi:MAG: PEP/pyruvate-binding domain-containing protein [Ignavibacteria bacterium]|jgi:CheY-like chemotaxis protein|nr:PEP/pyruvate-binding domain-containing protein [Ignavibacteria bacterium]
MNKLKHFKIEDNFGSRIKKFQKLMKFKIRDILLVSSLYDYYLFEEDGRLYDLIRLEYQSLNLSHAPEISHVSTGEEALELASNNHYDLIISTLHIEDMHVIRFAQMARQTGIDTPIILLAYDNRERKELVSNYDTSIFERIFIWQGDYKLLIGIIKYLEDRLNIENDTKIAEVQTIILVEDNVKFYSAYLPLIYAEIFKHSQRLIAEGVNLTHKFLRMRARPKIILCTNYEEAWSFYEKYESTILGVISDINFKYQGVKDPEAGLKLAMNILERQKDIPIVIQSSSTEFADSARNLGATFLQKGSPRLLHELSEFMINNFGFGDFVFRTPDLHEVGRASNLIQLEEQLRSVPEESIKYHAERNHFSNWLKARTEFWLAHRLRPRKVSDFATLEGLRQELINAINLYLDLRQRGIITDFKEATFDPHNSFARIGGGSLGGKARGLGFVNMLVNNFGLTNRFDGVHLFVPSAVVIGTEVFDQFLEENHLHNAAYNSSDDVELTRKFVAAENFPEEITNQLLELLEIVTVPLAVRSSSLLEDSQYQPFAGVYETYMIPNNNPDINVRLNELLQSIKCVYASTFFQKAKDYMKATTYRLEEEKMAIVIQTMVGAAHKDRFYPDFAGVAKSYNFYPIAPQKAADGIAMVALGLGKTVVDGGNSVRFCPKYPRHLLQFFSAKETIKTAQQNFYALDLNGKLDHNVNQTHDMLVHSYNLSKAEEDQTLYYTGSTYSAENDAVYDGISRSGQRVVTFAPILKHKVFPLAEVLDMLLEIGSWGMGVDVELEFAVNMDVPKGEPKQFGLLQMRPLVLSHEVEELDVDKVRHEDLICQSCQVLGNGAYRGIHDIIAVDYHLFERGKSRETALEVASLNAKLLQQRRPYILIGVGRWGTLDHWLGIPVSWDQISGASVIVESGFKDFDVTPSQGSHFFQNLTSFRIGYFTVSSLGKSGFIDWDWLLKETPVETLQFTKHFYFENEMTVRINGQQNKGVIFKPGLGL